MDDRVVGAEIGGVDLKHVDGETFSADVWQPWYEDKTRGRCVHSGKYDGLAYGPAVSAIAADIAAFISSSDICCGR